MSPEVVVPPRIVLVTGACRYLGAVVAARIAADPGVERVLAVDTAAPENEGAALLDEPPGSAGATRSGVEFVRADIGNPLIAKVIVGADVDTVVHMGVLASHTTGSNRAAAKELNVIGTMQLLAACQKARSVRKLVVKSSVAAYGVSPRDPAMFTEDTAPRETPRGGYARDIVEIEGYVRGFQRRRPDVKVTVLRFAPFLGARADTALTRYFSLPVVPTALGYDPRMQFLDVDDALEVTCRSVAERHPGVYNVAGDGVLLLSQAIRRAGRAPLPAPEFGLSSAAAFARRSGLIDFSLDQLDFLTHGRVVDTGRLIQEYGYRPRSTADCFDDFVRGHNLASMISPDNVTAVEHMLLDQIRPERVPAGPSGGARAGGGEEARWPR